MRVITLDAGGDANLTYLVMPPNTRQAWCVDPAFGAEALLCACTEERREISEVLLTHSHGDHVASLGRLLQRFPARVWVHRAEGGGVPGSTPIEREGPLPGLGSVVCLFTPGHTPGSVCYRIADDIFTGDTLFVDWVGRADLRGGDPAALFRSLARIRALPPHLRIRPGHDYGDTPSRPLDIERKKNKFLACEDYGAFEAMLPELAE